MRLKLYRASTAADAIARIRAELGPDALILNTRRVGDGVEITAALERSDPPPPLAGDSLRFHGVPDALAARLARAPLRTTLAAALNFATLPLQEGVVLLLAGPPGAGKTLTVARLASRLVMAGTKPLVITADGKRAGATEQLAAFTRLLGVHLVTATDAIMLARTIADRCDRPPTLIDLPGSDPFLSGERDELAALASTAGGRIVAVLPAGLDPGEATDLAQAYVEAGARMLVATKLDLARRLGGILAAAEAGLALCEGGIGPGAADGLVPLTPELLASRLQLPQTHRHPA